ncbi:VOC family protein [Hydrogenophaga sp.]|uniref:VOC family protein n=1 Tax=Hydrogenophaga sp. TaxID=1904254 RepID=UPI002731AAB7|nr:hypothetical protein [Hydrogenophaga sp.]MDP2406188.1 hypothetical protein [Hydrogenophaga sp.]MDP3886101.1 hypothetical protein [Hydrogenophaga sp.]MDZ4175397.1 hypothetical protein [Hydrogenophaga sp.]MDZ4356139.1 hypothetical protein [Variovorax sp.]
MSNPKGDFIWYELLTTDVDAAVADWTAAGGSVQMPAMDIPNVGRIPMLADPDGVPLYVMRGTSDASSTAFRIADARHVRWNQIAAKDDAAALGFYKARFGWEVVGAMPMGAMGDYHPPSTGSTSAR